MGSPPQTTATGIGSPRPWYLSRIWRPCLPGDIEAAGADVTAAVGLVPFRRRKAGDVDVISLHDVLEDRAFIDVFGRNALHRRHEMGAEAFAQFDLVEVGREAQRHILALAAEEIDEHAAALDRPGNPVEDKAGRAIVMERHARDHADILLPGQTAHVFDLVEPARLVEPLAQIVIRQARRDIGARGFVRGFRGCSDRIAYGVGWCDHESPRKSLISIPYLGNTFALVSFIKGLA